MENAASDAITISSLLATAGVAAGVAGFFGLITLFINRFWAKRDERKGKLKEIQDSIADMKGELQAHIAAAMPSNAGRESSGLRTNS